MDSHRSTASIFTSFLFFFPASFVSLASPFLRGPMVASLLGLAGTGCGSGFVSSSLAPLSFFRFFSFSPRSFRTNFCTGGSRASSRCRSFAFSFPFSFSFTFSFVFPFSFSFSFTFSFSFLLTNSTGLALSFFLFGSGSFSLSFSSSFRFLALPSLSFLLFLSIMPGGIPKGAAPDSIRAGPPNKGFIPKPLPITIGPMPIIGPICPMPPIIMAGSACHNCVL
mmetsp:Transcript_16564/g.38270  ORF Transcript_16564/g.38270 Transcript_16564/m.38270 type:complete len:223 (-) Transcript_16564:1018-1686(-)